MSPSSNNNADVAAKGRRFSRRQFIGAAVGAAAVWGGYSVLFGGQFRADKADRKVDVLLIGGGIMSATLGVYLAELEPGWTFEVFERLDKVAEESSNGWNNAGTGHSALCELNYTPMDDKGKVQIAKAVEINENFQISRQFWSHQVRKGVLGNPREFINSTPHMNLVFGEENRAFIRKRVEALKASPLFAGMEMSTDPVQIKQWIPIMMEGRKPEEVVTATRSPLGTDVNLGAITRQFYQHLNQHGVKISTAFEVRSITRNDDGSWRVSAFDIKDKSKVQTVDARHIFIGAGGAALPLLQLSGIPEAKQYGGFPVGGEFLVTENPQITSRHLAKVYGLADTGSPPMSVPHLDTRVLDGKTVLLFGPFATWSSKFLKNGSYFDMAKATSPSNIVPQLQVGMHEFALVKYLAQQLELSKEEKMAALRRYMPEAKDEDWRLWQAGQRVQIIKNVPGQGGVLKLGTEVVVSADRSVSALLGASPGGSTSPAIMLSLLEKVFPDRMKTAAWRGKIREIVPTYGQKLNENPELLVSEWAATADTLQLAIASPSLAGYAPAAAPSEKPGLVKKVPDIAL
ncbi:malate dehydrogenase (quinone) [Duganella sp. CF402]|uniref:malate dehydrogenase (quinone) n=1 Tax=unclassified Duganella TaxID=2636909 RepID=UPI0008BADDA8|nr:MULTISPECIES: malate dehydrogenase (quinone) [unclassified Duganella]RZT09713.1 malate dehydrogenase (quinone) [Duganella sp. BK701]SEL46037.1 malate dehydrogenase (quinone) [Duganella sp. CF402]